MFETSVEMKQAMFVLPLQNFATVVPFVIIIICLICLTNLKDPRLIVKSFILKTILITCLISLIDGILQQFTGC